jgi:ABC-2 type transport system permease protein
MGFFNFWLAKDLGRASAAFLMRSLTIMILYAIIFDIYYPQDLAQWIGVILAFILSWQVSFAWRFVVNLTAFWTPNAFGIARFAYGISWVLSGFVMPLTFYPTWFQDLATATPFPSMVYSIVEIYLGIAPGREMIFLILGQALWFLILVMVGRIMLTAGIRRLVVLGG